MGKEFDSLMRGSVTELRGKELQIENCKMQIALLQFYQQTKRTREAAKVAGSVSNLRNDIEGVGAFTARR
jgi:hypothetical protein